MHTSQANLVRLAAGHETQHEVYGRREPKPDKTQGVVAFFEVDGDLLRGDQFLDEIRKVVASEMRNQLQELRARRAAEAE